MDRIQARAFEGFVTESGDTLLRMATLLTADPDAAEDVPVGDQSRHRAGKPVPPLNAPRQP